MKNRLFMQALLKQPELMQKIMSFNQNFKDYLPSLNLELLLSELKEGNLGAVPSDLIVRLESNLPSLLASFKYELADPSSLETKLRTKLLNSSPHLTLFKLKALEFFLFDVKQERLCLLTDNELETLCFYLGASRFGGALSKVIWNQERQLLLKLMPQEFDFAVSLGQFLITQVASDTPLQIDELLPLRLKEEGLRTLVCTTQLFSTLPLQAYFLSSLLKQKHSLLDQGLELSTLSKTNDYSTIAHSLAKISAPRVWSLSCRILEQKVDHAWKQYLS